MFYDCIFCAGSLDMMCAKGTQFCCGNCHEEAVQCNMTDIEPVWRQPHLLTALTVAPSFPVRL